MAKLLLLLAVLTACGAESPPAETAPPANAAAIVDGSPVSKAELQEAVERLAGDLQKLPPERRAELSQQVLDRMIDDRLCAKALATDGAPISDADVDAELARRNAQADSSVPSAVVKESLRGMLCRKRLVERRGHFDSTVIDRGSDEVLARQDAVDRGRRWREEEQRIFKELRASAHVRIVTH